MKYIIHFTAVCAFLFGPALLDNHLPTFDFITPLMESMGSFMQQIAE